MLIKIKTNPRDTLTEAPHAPSSLIDRRSFLKLGASTAGALVMSPSILAMLKSDRALAADAIKLSQNPGLTYTALEQQGGHGLSHIFAPFREDGSTFAGANTSVLGTNANTQFDTGLIRGLVINRADPFYQAIEQGGKVLDRARAGEDTVLMSGQKAREVLSQVTGTLIACPSTDDSAENPLYLHKMIEQIRIGSLFTSLNVGLLPKSRNFDNSATIPGVVFAGADPDDSVIHFDGSRLTPKYVPASKGSVQDMVSSIALPPELGIGTNDADLLKNAGIGLMRAQEKGFKSTRGAKEFFNQMLEMLNILPSRANYDNIQSQFLLSSAENQALRNVFNDFGGIGSLDRKRLIASSANARGLVGSVSMCETGYDYHGGNGVSDFIYQHSLFARNLLIWAGTHIALGKEGFLHVFSDGAISWNGDLAVGDNGSVALVALFHVKPGGATSMRNVGHFVAAGGGAGEAASRNSPVSSIPQNSAFAALITYLKLAGLGSDADINVILNAYGQKLGLSKSTLLSFSAV